MGCFAAADAEKSDERTRRRSKDHERDILTAGAHAIIILDQAGWHGAKDLKIPRNLSLLPLPPRAPELNSQENIWQFMRQNWLSNRIFKSFDDIVDHCCYAWNTLIDQPWKIMSIARRDWAVVGQSI
jgi:transposase